MGERRGNSGTDQCHASRLHEGSPRFLVLVLCFLQDRLELGPTTQHIEPGMLRQGVIGRVSARYQIVELLQRQVRSALAAEPCQPRHRHIEPAVEIGRPLVVWLKM